MTVWECPGVVGRSMRVPARPAQSRSHFDDWRHGHRVMLDYHWHSVVVNLPHVGIGSRHGDVVMMMMGLVLETCEK